MMLLDINTGTSLSDFIKEVLVNRFPGDPIKQQIDDSNPKKINFSCPICGDSEKKKSKRRGNIYLKTNTYKCYNDGCMKFMEIEKFIAMYCHAYGLMPPDVFMGGKLNSKVKSKAKTSILNFLMNESLKDRLIDLEYFTNRFSLTRMNDFNIDSMATNYIKSRFLNESINFSECCYQDRDGKKIYIFNKDDVSDKIIGYSVRSADPGYMGPKYKMMNYTHINDEICDLKMTGEELSEIDHLNNIFNILNIDYKKPIVICEGQFDSMFLHNCIASTGVGKIKDTISMLSNETDKKIILDNDEAGKSESIRLLKTGHTVFLWSKLISDLKKEYPNRVKLLKTKPVTDVNKLYEFLKENSSNVNVSSFNKRLDKYFSNSMFDILYV